MYALEGRSFCISGFRVHLRVSGGHNTGIRHLSSGGVYGCPTAFILASTCYGSSHRNDSIEYGCPKVTCGDAGVVLELMVVPWVSL